MSRVYKNASNPTFILEGLLPPLLLIYRYWESSKEKLLLPINLFHPPENRKSPDMSSLLEPITIGGKLALRNRIVMGSMTRNRCLDAYKPGPAQVKHYADRARDGTGLIVTEGTFVDWTGCDWSHLPFMINEHHSKAWRKVTDAVHEVGGKIFFQAWHAGMFKPTICQELPVPLTSLTRSLPA